MNVTRDEFGHVYVDGERFPGVDRILRTAGLKPDLSKIPAFQLEFARRRGVIVDEACTYFDEGHLDWSTVCDEAKPYVEAWQRWTEDTGFRPLATQPIGVHLGLRYCGIPDVIGTIGEEPWVPDRKATASVDRSYGLQTAGYTMDGMVYPDGRCKFLSTRRAIVHLLKNTRYKVYTDHPDDVAGRKVFSDQDWLVFKAACDIARWKGLRP